MLSDNRKTKNLEKIKNNPIENKKIDIVTENKNPSPKNIENLINNSKNNLDNNGKRFSMPDRRKGYIQKATIGDHKVYIQAQVNMKMVKLEKYLSTPAKEESWLKH